MYYKTRGLVLRETNYREADKILTVLTEDLGKRTVKARGCRRKGSRLAAASQLLVYSELTLFEYRDYLTMNEAGTVEQFRGVRGDLELLSLCSYFAEVTEAVAEEGRAQPELLSLILNAMYALDTLCKPQALVKAAFEARMMCLAGYAPLLGECAVCGRSEPEAPRLDLIDGVLSCAGCAAGNTARLSAPIPPAALAALRYITFCQPKRLFSFALEGAALTALGQVSEAFLLAQTDRSFRTLDFYRALMDGNGEML